MTTVIGVDPGIAGALAVLDPTAGLVVIDLPVHALRTSTGKTRNELDLAALVAWLNDIVCAVDHVFIERVTARPGEGVVSLFRFGYAAGAVYGVMAALNLPITFVPPQAWQKSQGVGPGPDAARARAVQLYPTCADRLGARRDQHRADAVLIARHGLMSLAAERAA